MFNDIKIDDLLSVYNPFDDSYKLDEVMKINKKTIQSFHGLTINIEDGSVQGLCLEVKPATPHQIDNYIKYISKLPVINDTNITKTLNTLNDISYDGSCHNHMIDTLKDIAEDYIEFFFFTNDLSDILNENTNNKFIISNNGIPCIVKYKYGNVSFTKAPPFLVNEIIN